MDRLSTGISNLDSLIEGGLKPGSINMVTGQAGTGKSTFAAHFVKAGADAGEVTLYISVEETKDKFFDNMMRVGFDLRKLEEDKKLVYHRTGIPEVRGFLDQGIISFEQYAKSYEVKRVVVDSITALMLPYTSETSLRSSILTLFDLLDRWGATVLVTSEVAEGQARFGIEYLVDGIFRLYNRKVGQERVRTLEVFKMRGTDHSRQEIVYRLGEKGIILYPDEKILV